MQDHATLLDLGRHDGLEPQPNLDYIAAGGLVVGAVFGLAGTFVASPTIQASLWAIDSVGLVVATSLLAVSYFRVADPFGNRIELIELRGSGAATG